jgi:hypothetical protein
VNQPRYSQGNREEMDETLFRGAVLRVRFPPGPGAAAVRAEYEREIPKPVLVQAALHAIDDLLAGGERVGKVLLDVWPYKDIRLWEVKAPKTGTPCQRLLCYQTDHHNLVVLLARCKTTGQIPNEWKKVAYQRRRALLGER